MKLYLTRHGQTDWNTKRLVCGRAEARLTDLGRAQAAEMAEAVAATDVSVILSSPLERARETAGIVSARIGVPIQIEPLLIEQDFGSYEGRSVTDPEYKRNRENLFWRFPGGETTAHVLARSYTVIDRVRREYAGKAVLLVTHGCLCRAARTYFVEVPPGEFYAFYMNNCQLLEFEC